MVSNLSRLEKLFDWPIKDKVPRKGCYESQESRRIIRINTLYFSLELFFEMIYSIWHRVIWSKLNHGVNPMIGKDFRERAYCQEDDTGFRGPR